MDNSVILKGNPYGISVMINEESDYKVIKEKVIEKFKASEDFFKGASVCISFEGIRLPESCQLDLLNAIADNTRLDVVCLIDNSKETVLYYKDIIESAGAGDKSGTGPDMKAEDETEPGPESLKDYSTIVREDITPDNSIRSKLGVVVMGSVLPGGQVISGNDVIILGSARGMITAGFPDNTSARVYAFDLKDAVISIGGVTGSRDSAKGSFFEKLRKNKGMIMAFVNDGKVCFEQIM